jgi:hypothetical protein
MNHSYKKEDIYFKSKKKEKYYENLVISFLIYTFAQKSIIFNLIEKFK